MGPGFVEHHEVASRVSAARMLKSVSLLALKQKPLRRRLDGAADVQCTLEQDPLQLRRVGMVETPAVANPPQAAGMMLVSVCRVHGPLLMLTRMASARCGKLMHSRAMGAGLQAQVPGAAAALPPPLLTQQQQPRKREARETVYAYDAAALGQADGSDAGGGDTWELCFEELRARHMRQEHAAAAAGSGGSQAAAAHPTPEPQPGPQQQPTPRQQPSPPETQQAAAGHVAAASATTPALPAPATLAAASVPRVDVPSAAAADPQSAVSQSVPAVSPAIGSHDRPAASGSVRQLEQPTAQAAAAAGVQPPAVSVALRLGQQPPAAGVTGAAEAEDAATVPAARSPHAKRRRGCGLALRPTPQQSPSPQQPDATEAATPPMPVSSFAAAAASSPSGAAGGPDDMDNVFAGAFSGPVLDQVLLWRLYTCVCGGVIGPAAS